MITKKHLIIVALATFCLAATILTVVPTRSQDSRYDVWLDINDDGIINMLDIGKTASAFGSSGVPINKTEMLLYLQAEIDSVNASVQDLQLKYNDMYGFVTTPAYDSGWVAVTNYGSWMVFEHGLGTTNVLVQVIRDGPNEPAGSAFGINQYKYGELLDWVLLNNETITVRIAPIEGMSNDAVRVMMWKIPEKQ